MMKFKSLCTITLFICLMSSSVFATYNWMQDPAYADNWTEPNQWDQSAHSPPTTSPGMPPVGTGTEMKMITNTGTGGTAHCTVNSAVGSYISANVSVNGNLYINNSNANIGFNRTGSKNGLRVGSNSAGGNDPAYSGTVNQSAGTVGATNLYLGYAGSNGNLSASGNYIISGGTLSCSSSLSVGTGINGSGAQTTAGKFTVDGASGSISVTALKVGGTDAPTTTNSGTLEFKLGSTVSAIGCTSVSLDAGSGNSTTALIVSATGTPSGNDILLVKNTGSAVVGFFDTVQSDSGTVSAIEGASVVLGGNAYTLTYMYDSVSGTKGSVRSATYNDIALVPEPATLALLSLGLLVIRRNKK
jgi:hypothetical protein